MDVKNFPILGCYRESFGEKSVKEHLTEFSGVWAYTPEQGQRALERIERERTVRAGEKRRRDSELHAPHPLAAIQMRGQFDRRPAFRSEAERHPPISQQRTPCFHPGKPAKPRARAGGGETRTDETRRGQTIQPTSEPTASHRFLPTV